MHFTQRNVHLFRYYKIEVAGDLSVVKYLKEEKGQGRDSPRKQ